MEASSHAFVVRVWAEKGAASPWRGHVTHVQSGERRYFGEMKEVVAFIATYLTAPGDPPDAPTR